MPTAALDEDADESAVGGGYLVGGEIVEVADRRGQHVGAAAGAG